MLSIKYYKGIVLWLDRHCSSCITFSFFSFLLLDHLHLLLVMALWQKNWSSKINLDNLNLFQNAFNVLWEYWQLQGITLGIDLTYHCVSYTGFLCCVTAGFVPWWTVEEDAEPEEETRGVISILRKSSLVRCCLQNIASDYVLFDIFLRQLFFLNELALLVVKFLTNDCVGKFSSCISSTCVWVFY